MAGVDPAVEAPGKGVGHAVGVAMAEDAVERLAAIGPAVAVLVRHQEDVGNAVHERRAGRWQGQDANRNIQAVGKGLDLRGPAIGAELGKDLDGVARLGPRACRVGVFHGIRNPEASAVIEGEIERLANIGLGGDKLDFKAGGQMKGLPLVLGRARGKG